MQIRFESRQFLDLLGLFDCFSTQQFLGISCQPIVFPGRLIMGGIGYEWVQNACSDLMMDIESMEGTELNGTELIKTGTQNEVNDK